MYVPSDNTYLQFSYLTARTKHPTIRNYMCLPLVIRAKFRHVYKKEQHLNINVRIQSFATECVELE
jgi:hypothetical protein